MVGAIGWGAIPGAAYIFADSGSGWREVAKLTATDGPTKNEFGNSVAISGDTTIILDKGYGGLGISAAYVLRPMFSVISLWPTLTNQPADHVEVWFSQPVVPGSFTADDVRLWGPGGEVPITDVAFVSEVEGRQTYRVSFPSQSTNGRYQLSIGPDVTGPDGKLLDQDYDGNGGEAIDDEYWGSFKIDTLGPRITRHTPAGDNAGTVDHVDIWFSETLNTDALTLEDISIAGPNGIISPTDLTVLGGSAFRISFPQQTTLGEYHVRVGPEVEDLAGNLMDQDRDGVQGEPDDGDPQDDDDVYEAPFNLVDVDLTLFDVSVQEAELWAGEAIHVSWSGENASGMPLLGDWTDAVYFSTDDHWDIDDVLIETIPHTGGLAENDDYSESVEVIVPGALPGDYYIIVRADLYNQEKEGADEGNNIVAAGPLPLYVHALPTDTLPVSGTLSDTDPSDYYALGAEAGESLVVTLNGLAPEADADFFVSYEKIPTARDYDFRSTIQVQGDPQVVVSNTLPGTYYVLVYGDQLPTPTPYDLSAGTGQFVVGDITPNRHSVGGVCIATVYGAGFDESTTVEFIGSDDSVWAPIQTRLISHTTMTVELDLPVWPQDVYDVRVSKPSADPWILEDSFTVTPAGSAQLETKLVVPRPLQRWRRATIWIEYANAGDDSMLSPLFRLSADGAVLTLDASLSQDLSPDTPSAGRGDVAQVMASGSGATPGILQPGDSGRIPVFYRGMQQPWNLEENAVEFVLSVLTADSTEAIDWDQLKGDMQPELTPADAWNAVWANFTQQVGNTWGDYVAMLDDNLNYLHQRAQDIIAVNLLLAFEIEQASGLGPFEFLSAEVDAYSPAPGIPLAVGRVYGQSIDSRYELGPLGRGWRHNWDVYVEELVDGDVIIRGPSGADRYFDRIGDNYASSPGDAGHLVFSNGSFHLTEKHGTVWQFRSDNLLDYVEDTNGRRITLGYTSGLLTSLAHSNGDQLLLDYNGDGRIWHVTDPRGPDPVDDHVTTFEYDAATGEYLETVTAPGNHVTTYTYETTASPVQKTHALLSVQYPDGTHDYFEYDDHGRVIQTHGDAGAQAVDYAYDSAGTVTVVDATARQTDLYYGLGGQLVQVRDGEGNAVNPAYDGNYQLIEVTGGGGEQYAYSYDYWGNLTEFEDPLRRVTEFSYTGLLKSLDSVADAREESAPYDYVYVHNSTTGNLHSINYEDGTHESFTHYVDHPGGQPDGLVESWTNRRGETVTYTYWPSGRLQTKDYSTTPASPDYQYTHDEAGNLLSTTGPEGTTLLEYDPETDWLTRIEYPGGKFFEFEYWDLGMRKKRTDQDGNVVNYVSDALGRLDQMTDGTAALIVDYDYDAAGRMERKTLGNGVYTTYSYDDAGQLEALENRQQDASLISSFHYTYDASGRRDSMTVQRDPASPFDGTYEYGYDPLGQLVLVTYPDGHEVSYEYDSVGNRIEVIDDGISTAYTTNEMNQYTDVGGVTYTYDDDGNLETKTEGGVTTVYAYDIENRLVQVDKYGDGTELPPTETWEYVYDALGIRVASVDNGVETNYLVDLIGFGNVAAEYDEFGALIARYHHGFGLLARTDATDPDAYYTFDVVGATSELTDPNGNVLNNYSYDPFGISLSKTEAVLNPFGYVGEYGVMQEDNGLEFMRSRLYATELGRFDAEDPFGLPGGHTNLYTYCANSPLNWIDPRGTTYEIPTWEDIAFDLGVDVGMAHATSPDVWRLTRLGMAYKTFLNDNREAWEEGSASGVIHSSAVMGLKGFLELLDPSNKFKFKGRAVDAFDRLTYNAPLAFWNWWYSRNSVTAPTDPADESTIRLVRAHDPNDKLAPKGHGEAGYLAEDSLLAYKIRFENKSDATAPAAIITITDTLDDDLDLSTFELNEIGFADHTVIVPEGSNHYEGYVDVVVDNEFVSQGEIRVQIEVALDASSRELTLAMIGVDPQTGWLPEDILLGILYPNDDTGRGDGYISYTVKPVSGLTTGTEITNKASIVFDWNDPIETPLVRNTIDALPPTSNVLPLPPETTTAAFLAQWTGEDDPDGSGISHYDIYVSDNGAGYVQWLDDTEATSAVFIGEGSHTYGFYSIATDNVGHEEAPPTVPDTETTLIENPFSVVLDQHIFYNNSAYDFNDAGPSDYDDNALAPDKEALMPGGIATFDNYTSYSLGINGIMVDIAGLPTGHTPVVTDFEFKVGNGDVPDTWMPAPDPTTISVRQSAGTNNSDRVTLIWDDHAIRREWLQVTVLAGTLVGLAEDHVFCFGNAVAEAGNSDFDAQVTTTDLLLARNNPRNVTYAAAIDFPYDYDRDKRVNATDVLLARNNQTNFLNRLVLIDLSGSKAFAPEATRPESTLEQLAWLHELERMSQQEHSDDKHDLTEATVDMLLAMGLN